MKIQDWFENWGITGLKLNAGFLQMEWEPQPEEQQAAWELYIELITRITTQDIDGESGDEAAALTSIHDTFGITRQLLKEKGRKAETFSKIAVVILNQKLRHFTGTWHKRSLAGAFTEPEQCARFWEELKEIQNTMRHYAALLAAVAGVEDFQKLDEGPLEAL